MVVPKKLTAKQEMFVQEFIKCGNQSEAYRTAYDVGENTKPESVWQLSCRLMAEVKVSSRVYELQQKAQERTLVTVESLTKELEEARAMADKTENASAMTGASMGKAKLHGLDVQKIDLKGSMSVIIDQDNKDL